MNRAFITFAITFWAITAWAGAPETAVHFGHGMLANAVIIIFILAYLAAITEEFSNLPKSGPMVIAASLIWIIIALSYGRTDESGELVYQAAIEQILSFGKLLLFLIVSMTYINVLDERKVFDAMRASLGRRGFSHRMLFWVTGCMAFLLSAIFSSLAVALIMGAIVMSVGKDSPRFVVLSCINIVVAANAGSAFSPFGSVSALIMLQKGLVELGQFSHLIIPSLVSFIVSAACMHFAVPDYCPFASGEVVLMRRGAKRMIAMAMITICTTIILRAFLHLPTALGMMTGLIWLQFFGIYLARTSRLTATAEEPYNYFITLDKAQWDTLLFLYGIILCIGGLDFMGLLGRLSQFIYIDHGPTVANIILGLISSLVDDAPLAYVLTSMHPAMSTDQWLLATFVIGIGSSLLSVGSVTGIALMGQTRGLYTFFGHLKWMPAIALGYAAGVGTYVLTYISF